MKMPIYPTPNEKSQVIALLRRIASKANSLAEDYTSRDYIHELIIARELAIMKEYREEIESVLFPIMEKNKENR